MSEQVDQEPVELRPTERVKVAELTAHPRNYRYHPEDQLLHIEQSIREHGIYRNVVVARDLTILAGHGVVQASERLGLDEIPVIKLDLDPDDPKALKILTGDNELQRQAEVDDRTLTELLREIRETDVDGLLGTGFDDQMLANLVMITRSADEIGDLDEAAQWVGLPHFEEEGSAGMIQVMITCDTDQDRERVVELLGIKESHYLRRGRRMWSTRWPLRDGMDDPSSLLFDA